MERALVAPAQEERARCASHTSSSSSTPRSGEHGAPAEIDLLPHLCRAHARPGRGVRRPLVRARVHRTLAVAEEHVPGHARQTRWQTHSQRVLARDDRRTHAWVTYCRTQMRISQSVQIPISKVDSKKYDEMQTSRRASLYVSASSTVSGERGLFCAEPLEAGAFL